MTTVGYEVTGIDTLTLDGPDRFDAWSEHVRTNHGGLGLVDAGTAGFRGSTIVQRARDLQLVEFTSDAIRYTRDERAVAADGDTTVRVLVPRTGRFRVEDGASCLELKRGAGALVSMAAPFSIAHGPDAGAWVFSMPAEVLPRSVDPRVTSLLDLSTGAGAVVAAMVDQLSQQRDAFSRGEFLDAAESLANLLARRALDGIEGDHTVARAALELVRAHCDDPGLTPATLAARLGWSVRYVQNVARTLGTTPSRMIRDARLDRAAGRLRDPAWADRGIAEVAHASGFGSLSTFNATFRSAFDHAPSDLRR